VEAPIEQSGLVVFSQQSEMVVGFFAGLHQGCALVFC
jgi:hypothetical protein